MPTPNLGRVILLVEDNPDDEALTLRALRRANVVNEVVVAHDGQQALDKLEGADGEALVPALVMLDLKLPRVSGLELLQRMRTHSRLRRLPVVVFTSSSEDRDMMASYDLGANAYVRKPVDFTEFAEAVQQLGLFWLLVNEPPPG